jgi:poly(A) polymerase
MSKKTLSAAKYGVSNQLVNSDAMYVIEKLHSHGFDGYIVGGGIRDLLLRKTPKDFDIVTNATPELVRKIFKRNSIIIGRRFKIVHVVFNNINPDKMINNRPLRERNIIEISTYRSAKILQQSLNEYGRIMVDNNYGNQKEDSSRRDFTINALYYDPIREVIIDYHDGIKDIEAKVVRMIGDPYTRYLEDPVRMLRAIRLAVKLGLTIENNTSDCFKQVKQLLKHEHRGRLYEEMLKILLSGSASECIASLKQLELPKHIFILFDKLFFTAKPDELALKIAVKTDTRLKEANDVSTIFILAGLMWNLINDSWQEIMLKGETPRLALLEAINENKQFAYTVGITKNAYLCMHDVWMLQYDFENPSLKRIDTLLSNPRFRQAWHLYSARSELNQVDLTLFNWWESFINADAANRMELLDQLQSVYAVTKPKKKKRYNKKKVSG